MHFSQFSFFTKKTRSLFVPISAIAMTALTACASFDAWTKQGDSPLPIEVHHSGGGQIMNFGAYETSNRLYVSGLAKKLPVTNTAHVDVRLLKANGCVIAEKQDNINPCPRPGGGRRFTDTYVVSFPLNEARMATKICVKYHSRSHS